MLDALHHWLLGHPISQSFLIGLLLFLPALYAKELRGLLETPPQRLGVWWRKARLKANIRTVSLLRRAHSNPHILLFVIVSYAAPAVLFLTALVNLAGVFAINTYFAVRDGDPEDWFSHIHGGRNLQNAIFAFLAYGVAFLVMSLFGFASKLAKFEKSVRLLDAKIARLQSQLPQPPASEEKQHQEIRPSESETIIPPQERRGPASRTSSAHDENPLIVSVGTLVNHPRYGPGRVTEFDARTDSLAVAFERHGNKRLIRRFAQLTLR